MRQENVMEDRFTQRHEDGRLLRGWSTYAVGATIMLCALALLCGSALAAEGERLLEPRLSLIGGCGVDETSPDKVEDPGCPATPPPGTHPPATFSNPRAVTTDDYGNVYVASFGSALNGSKGRIDIFCADGTFASEVVTPGPASVAVDGGGELYVFSSSQSEILRFEPGAPYLPETCEIEYAAPSVFVADLPNGNYFALAINRSNDHLFANVGGTGVIEYGSAAEANAVVRTNPGPSWSDGGGVAVDAKRKRLYSTAGPSEERIDIFDLNTVEGAPPNDKYKKVGSIEDSELPNFPKEHFGTQLSIAVDEGNGNVFVLDGENCTLYEFGENGTYLQTIPAGFLQCNLPGGQITVDNGPTSPNGKVSEEAGEGRFLYVPSNRTKIGHSYAFFVSTVGPPEIKSIAAANVSEDEAELQAQIDPNNLETTYRFELKVEGAASWTPVGDGKLAAGNSVVQVAAPATGLQPGTAYRFRAIAANAEAEGEKAVVAEGSFSTYPSVSTETSPCANSELRTGHSALLPDCRAYELVTPPDTNSRAPKGAGVLGGLFTTRQVSPAGDGVTFGVDGGSLPGLGGIGSLVGDPYLATRTSSGWSTTFTGPKGSEATVLIPGSSLPDGHGFWLASEEGSAVLEPNTAYIRYPDGHAELLGQGSLEAIEPHALGRLISEGGGHIVFSTGELGTPAVQLEPGAAPDGTIAIYDRTADGVTHVVSLKPGEVPLNAKENAKYQGASLDGLGVAFSVGGTLYLRYRDEATFAIGTGVEFAGVAEGGNRVFYVEGGDLMRFDALSPEGERVTPFTATGDVVPVTVASDGSAAYFISESAIAGSGPNPQGDEPHAAAQNLYRSVEGQVDFVATVTDRDMEGDPAVFLADGLGLWDTAVSESRSLGAVPARSTPDGSVFLFKSRAALTDYDPGGKAEIYRYDPAAGQLQCLSCNPTGAAAGADATLQSSSREGQTLFNLQVVPENLRADGRRAFFETDEALVAGDSDGLRDVYEWEDKGVGSCDKAGGCIYLVSSPQSRQGEYLWGVSKSGDDVFFLSSELLVGADAATTPSIYDARVDGGFAEAAAGECAGEGCRPRLSPPPALPMAGTPVRGAGDNAKPPRTCPKGKHKAKHKGKVRCVRNKKKPHSKKQASRQRAGAEKKGGRR